VYADDVVLFLKPDNAELQAIKEILTMFGEASGLKVNYRKTTATVIRGNAAEEERVATIL
jgi:nucleoside diphosphate kinase